MAMFTITYEWTPQYEGIGAIGYFNCKAYSEADALAKFSYFVLESEGFFQAVKCEAFCID